MKGPDRFAVIGDPVHHSFSPSMHNAAFAAAGLNALYEAIRVQPAELLNAVGRLRDRGYRGLNVTIPHKREIMPYLDRLDTDASWVGSVNTVVRQGEAFVGHNTDVYGFLAALQNVEPVLSRSESVQRLNRSSPGAGNVTRKAVLFGSGGSARAVLCGLGRMDAEVVIVSRDPERADALARESLHARGTHYEDPLLDDQVANADIIVNATPMGMAHLQDSSPLPSRITLRRGAIAFDLVYGRETPFMREARRQGCLVTDGLEMLVQQGAKSFELWTGVKPDTTVMRDACRARLRELQT